MSAARFRRNYADDATLEDRVFELLETCFPGIGNRRRECARLGASWTHCSVPFVLEENGRIVAAVLVGLGSGAHDGDEVSGARCGGEVEAEGIDLHALLDR